jgi:drug/metabolite transporter (DMT)-like permease
MGRYRRRSSAAQVIGDTVYVANRASWWGALLMGALGFLLFAVLLPHWVDTQIASLEGNQFQDVVAAILGRRLHWLRWTGIACGLIGVFFAIRNYHRSGRYGRRGEGIVALLAKLLGRSLD